MAKRTKSAKKRTKTADKKNFYLSAALFCESVIEDKDNVNTIVRMVDKIMISTPLPLVDLVKSDALPAVQLMAFLAFKTGVKQKLRIRFVANSPSGKRALDMQQEMVSTPNWGGATLKARIALRVSEAGTHWFDVYANDKLITKMPLTIEYQQITLAELSSPKTS